MILTDKCLKDFEKWYKAKISSLEEYSLLTEKVKEIHVNWEYDYFDTRDLSMKYSVIVDFLDSVGIEIEISHDIDYEYSSPIGWIWFIEGVENNKWHETRQEARKEALKKANEIYNSK